MRTMRALLLVLIVAGCDNPQGNLGADGYRVETQMFVRDAIELKIVLYPSVAALNNEYGRTHRVPAGRELMAFSSLLPDGTGTCTIHAVDPRVSYHPEFLGHELTHCLLGEFHPHQP